MKRIDPVDMPLVIKSGKWTNGHVQGIAVDKVNGYIYFSFTTVLVKTKFDGTVIGSVEGLTGHLGCLDFNDENGKVYGSIEYKHDSIGKGILKDNPGAELAEEDAFYIAIFDVDKIDRIGMHAEKDGVMKAVYLPDVVEDYSFKGEREHKYACSGIDGLVFGPKFGCGKDTPYSIFVAYGIYGEIDRDDNDNQVILEFDWRLFDEVAKPLTQLAPHKSGLRFENRYFLYTGNTNWGIQNIEYDEYSGDYFVAVYVGKKPQYKNFPMFRIDGNVPAKIEKIHGLNEEGLVLTLKKSGVYDEVSNTYGLTFSKGQTGIASLGDGYFYVSHNKKEEIDGVKYHSSTVYKYTLTDDTGENPFVICE